jgi:type II secretory pathway component PulL
MRIEELPARDCAFALLDIPIGSGTDAQKELLFQLESVLPQPLETVHAAFERVDGMVIAVACERSRIDGFRSSTDRLVPASIPAWTGIEDTEAVRMRLNLLTGEMRPVSAIRRSKNTAMLVCACLLFSMVLFSIGVSRRLSEIGKQQEILNGQIAVLYDNVLPRSSSENAQPKSVRFATILNTVRSTRTGSSSIERVDLVSDLSELLSQWPRIENLQVQSLTIQPGTARLQMSAPDNDRSTAVIDALVSMPGWESAGRNTTPRADRVEISLSLIRKEVGISE